MDKRKEVLKKMRALERSIDELKGIDTEYLEEKDRVKVMERLSIMGEILSSLRIRYESLCIDVWKMSAKETYGKKKKQLEG